jgi:hypothetical protein
MLTLRDHQSRELVDPWAHLGSKRRRLLELNWVGVFRECLLEHLTVQELAAGFRDGHGRPSKDLSVALGALILQQLRDLTDEQTTEAAPLNIAWHYALDIRQTGCVSLRADAAELSNTVAESRPGQGIVPHIDRQAHRTSRHRYASIASGFNHGQVGNSWPDAAGNSRRSDQ